MSGIKTAKNLLSLLFSILICNHPTKNYRACFHLEPQMQKPTGFFGEIGGGLDFMEMFGTDLEVSLSALNYSLIG
ncbi:MAG: hypothetical protein JRJ69_13500 [Deltaproteobacteria bacterium]|nr:hypothetical protein [Deltaproteobacteria bacterium]MBW1738529.1 hypothetical protein [Deltaproteobacteria bacterium]MBW1910874.1 hypothetical protein [Deltaproteobacteria bacterium]MBW2035123.1 hypothetical protein [Deltaproteobacteria bacterium]MBW2115414.1 hypothetical protein [Deltaproteobacteria bacterium]